MERSDADFERLARLARVAGQGAHAGRAERRARARFLARIARRRPPLFGLLAAAALGLAGVVSGVWLDAKYLQPVAPGPAVVRLPPLPAAPPRPAPPPVAPVLAGGSVVRFPEGTEFRFAADGRGRLLDSGPAGARIVLEAGSLAARVVRRPETTWRIEAGPFRIFVTGTAFRVGWDPTRGGFELAMSEGSVRVEGPAFAQRLGAGQLLRATVDDGIVQLGPAVVRRARGKARVVARRVAMAAPARVAAPASSRPSSPPSWSQRLAQGGFREVMDEAARAGLDLVVAERGLDDLAALATAARLSGEVEIARRALGALRARFPGTPAAAEGAFLLGRLADDVDHDPPAALVWYRRSLAEAPAGPLAAESLGRQLALLAGSDRPADRAAAVAAAREYLGRFPDGAHAARARALVSGPPTAR